MSDPQVVWPEDALPAKPPVPKVAFPLLVALGLALWAFALTTGAQGALGLNMLLWVGAFVGACLWRLRRTGKKVSREGVTLLGVALGFAAVLTFWMPPSSLYVLDILALLLALFLGADTLRFGGLARSSVVQLFAEALLGGLRVIYGIFMLLERFPWGRLKLPPMPQASRWLVGLALTVPVVVVFGGLLVSADAGFAQLVAGLPNWQWTLPDLDGLIWRLFALAGWVFFAGGLVYAALLAVKPNVQPAEAGAGRLGLIEIGLPLGTLSGLFTLFLAVQLPHLLGNALPEGVTFAEYIRQGFDQLMTVGFLTLALLLAAHALTSQEARQRPAYRSLNLAVLLPLALILLVAAQRWRLYTLAYGLSETRVLGAAFLVWILGCLVWLALLLWRGQPQRFAYPALLYGLGVLALTTIINPAALIARTNIYREQAGVTNHLRSTRQTVNTDELLQLGMGAVPSVMGYLAKTCPLPASCASPQQAAALEQLRAQYGSPRDWRGWNFTAWRAYQQVRRLP